MAGVPGSTVEVSFEGNRVTGEKRKRALLVAAPSMHIVDIIGSRCASDKVMHFRTAKLSLS